MDTSDFFGTEKIGKILFKLAPPVMLAQLIQTLYSIVDNLFVGRYSDAGLTALSIIYQVQPLMIALAVGAGVGINTGMAAKLGAGRREEADAYAGVGTPLAAALIMRGRGFRPSPPRAVCPKHIAHIFRLGVPNILMQSAYTFYILGLNLILAGFSDQAVTVLGIYYKRQTFFFIPLGGYADLHRAGAQLQLRGGQSAALPEDARDAILFGMALMVVGTVCFVTIPGPMLRVFSQDIRVIEIGRVGFHFVGMSFLPLVTSLTFPAVGSSLKSSLLTVIRTEVLFVPLGYLFSRFGLNWFWLTVPVTELVTTAVGLVFCRRFLKAQH